MRKFFAFMLILFVFAPIGLCALFAASVGTWALNPDFYRNLLNDERLYQALLEEQVPTYLSQARGSSFAGLPTAALGAGLQAVLTPEYLRDQAQALITNIFDALEGRAQTITPTVDIRPIKAALSGAGASAFASAYANNLPPCSAKSPAAGSTPLPTCLPQGAAPAQLADQVAAALPGAVTNLPDEMVVGDTLRVDLTDVGSLDGGLNLASLGLGGALALLFGVAVLVWVVIGLLGGTSPRGVLRWLSGALFVPVALLAVFALLISPLVLPIGAAMQEIRVNNAPVSPEFSAAIAQVLQNGLGQFSGGMLTVAALAGVVVVALYILSFIVPGRRRRDWYGEQDTFMEKPKRTIP
ncbi:MAG: hypothetical protein IT323_12510 [Anaerolineae bacterium]|nr:hypothetical protein [Anaerolineae bacterium]